MNLKEFYNYKSQFMKDIISDEKIVRLINEDVPFESARSLIYSQVFPYEYIPDTAETSKTYVCCEVDIQRSYNKTYLQPILYVWVFTHASKQRLDSGGVRVDNLCSEICEKINGSRFYGLGELNLYSAKRFAPLTDMNGKVLTFQTKEFNRQYDPKKPTPANRRLGY